MGKYAADHADALADVAEAGEDCPFTTTLPGIFDPATETWSDPTVTALAGKAIGLEGDPDQYRALNLVAADPETLLWLPATYGAAPPIGAVCSWGGVSRSLKAREPIAPDGIAIAWVVVVAV